jgi:hypothetical protein
MWDARTPFKSRLKLVANILMAGMAVIPMFGGPITMVLDTKDFQGNEVGRVLVLNANDDNNGIPDLDEHQVQARGDNKDLASGLSTATFKTNLSFDLNSASCDSVKLGIRLGRFRQARWVLHTAKPCSPPAASRQSNGL